MNTPSSKATPSIYLAQMKWCEREEPVCAGTNQKEVAQKALKMLRDEYGVGPIPRGMAMCSVPITMDDIEVVKIPVIGKLAEKTNIP